MSGEVIDYNNIRSKYGTGWFKTFTMENQSYTLVINAPNICIDCYVKTSAWLREAKLTVQSYYYNGSTWVPDWGGSISCSGGNGEDHYRWRHNRQDESYPNYNNSNYHMWRLDVNAEYESKNSWAGLNVWMGGINLYNQSEYDNLCKDKEIRYCRSDELWSITSSSTYKTLQEFLDHESPSIYRGTPITDANGKYVVYTPI